MRPKPTPRRPGGDSPLGEQMKALAEQEAKLKADMAHRQRVIDDAPRLAKEAARRRQEEYVARKSRTEARFGAPHALRDPRFGYELNAGAPAQRKTLRKERNRGMATFFALLLVLAAVVYWLYFTFLRAA